MSDRNLHFVLHARSSLSSSEGQLRVQGALHNAPNPNTSRALLPLNKGVPPGVRGLLLSLVLLRLGKADQSTHPPEQADGLLVLTYVFVKLTS